MDFNIPFLTDSKLSLIHKMSCSLERKKIYFLNGHYLVFKKKKVDFLFVISDLCLGCLRSS